MIKNKGEGIIKGSSVGYAIVCQAICENFAVDDVQKA